MSDQHKPTGGASKPSPSQRAAAASSKQPSSSGSLPQQPPMAGGHQQSPTRQQHHPAPQRTTGAERPKSAAQAHNDPDKTATIPAVGRDTTKPAPKADAEKKADKQPEKADKGNERAKVIAKPRRTRKARLRLAQIDPWSAMKTTFLFSFAFLVASLAAVAMLYMVVEAAGLFDSINAMVGEVLGTKDEDAQFRVQDFLSFGRVVGFTAIVGALNVVLMTTIGTLGAFLYNLAATILGGLEVTLAED